MYDVRNAFTPRPKIKIFFASAYVTDYKNGPTLKVFLHDLEIVFFSFTNIYTSKYISRLNSDNKHCFDLI